MAIKHITVHHITRSPADGPVQVNESPSGADQQRRPGKPLWSLQAFV